MLRRPAGLQPGGGVAARARRTLLRLRFVRQPVELRPHPLRVVRLVQGYRPGGDRGRHGRGEGGDLRRVPLLCEGALPEQGSRREVVADDVASLALDLLMRGRPYRRAGFNPFLLGY